MIGISQDRCWEYYCWGVFCVNFFLGGVPLDHGFIASQD